MTLRVGIIGAAWGAVAHLPAWRAVSGVEVTAICTSRRATADAAAARLAIPRAFSDATAMCRDPDLDIIDCGSRPDLREFWVAAALAAGKHVYNAVPFAATWGGAVRLAEAQAMTGGVGIVDAFSQWLPQIRLLKETLDDGALGIPFGGSCRFAMSLFNRPDPRFPYAWFAEARTGVSALRNLGSHALHLLVHLLGPVDAVVADDRLALTTWTYPDGSSATPSNPDLAHAILRFRSGLVMTLQASWSASAGEGFALDVFGSNGRVALTSPSFPTSRDAVLRVGRAGGAMEDVAMPDRLTRQAGLGLDWRAAVPPSFPMALAMRSMILAIEGREKAAPDFAQAFEVERILEALRLSNAEHRWVRVADIAAAPPPARELSRSG